MNDNYFPLIVAKGNTFCNRVQERAYLKNNIERNIHSLVVAPRRYGKTSLILKVLEENNIAFALVDLFSVTHLESVFLTLQKAVQETLSKILPQDKKLLQKLQSFFGQFVPSIELTLAGQKIKFNKETRNIMAADIIELLLGLENLAKEINKNIVIVVDELQQLYSLKDSLAIEGAIRHAVERSSHVCYIFSGSTRHLLLELFEDSERPLYRFSDKMTINRIHQEDYIKHINLAAKKQWKAELDTKSMERIFQLTQLHPYYINVLCSRLWGNAKSPTEKTVDKTWNQYVQEEKVRVIQDFSSLSLNQKSMLLNLAIKPEKEPTGNQFLAIAKLSSSSANQALNMLIKKDYVFLNQEHYYQVLDPVMQSCLAQVAI